MRASAWSKNVLGDLRGEFGPRLTRPLRSRRRVFDAPPDTAVPARSLAMLSLFAWTAAITAGRLLAYV